MGLSAAMRQVVSQLFVSKISIESWVYMSWMNPVLEGTQTLHSIDTLSRIFPTWANLLGLLIWVNQEKTTARCIKCQNIFSKFVNFVWSILVCDTRCRPLLDHRCMTQITCTCPLTNDILLGQTDGQILRMSTGISTPVQRYRFSGEEVQWMQTTPNRRTVMAGHACGLIVVFDSETGQLQDGNTCQLQSEYKPTPAITSGLLSPDGRWLLAYTHRAEKDVGFLLDIEQKYSPRRQVLPKSTPAFTLPQLKHRFDILNLQPNLLQCHLTCSEPLRHVQSFLVCSEHIQLLQYQYDRRIGEELFLKDIKPSQVNTISWSINFIKANPKGTWLGNFILTASNDAGQVGHHVLPFETPQLEDLLKG